MIRPGVSYPTLVGLAALAGVGGGNFASSMANINAFFPDRLKGWALGINAGGGNLGVAAVQLSGSPCWLCSARGGPASWQASTSTDRRCGHRLRVVHGQPQSGA
jgi:MFS transporter, NNP family, nitrate/nitrite transporter